jgi:hypothetical protein
MMFFTCGVCEAQNLVPNPSFEIYDTCPNTEDQIQYAIGWSKFSQAGTTPDYYNACDTGGIMCVPNGGQIHQPTVDGNAYAALATFASFPNYREHIGIQLSQSLTVGQKYFLSFYTVMGEALGHSTPSNNIGMLLSTAPYNLNNPSPIHNFAHLYSIPIISDTVNWIHLSTSIIADSAYNYCILGNFFDDANTDTIKWNINTLASYYAVEMICISIDSLTCNGAVGINELKNKEELILFPNPFSDRINITVKRNELVEVNLFDVTSRKIINKSFAKSISINTEQLAKGIYIYEVRNKNGVIKKGKVVKE